jgi:flagellar biosynthesis/type III secretory pathway protein FliH
MLIKGNKSKEKEAMAQRANARPRDETLPDQIMNFIGQEVAKRSTDNSVIDERALDAIMGQRLSKLDIVKQQISQEEIDEQAQRMIEARAQELINNLESELALKKHDQEALLKQIKSSAEIQAKQILEQANEHVLNEAKKLDQEKRAFVKEKEVHFFEIEKLQYEALKDAIDEAKPYVSETVELFKNLNLDRRDLANMIKDNVATIAYDVAKQILNYEVHVNDNLLEQQVLHSVNKLLDSKGVMKIAINPEDKDKQKNLSELLMNVLDPSVRLVFLYDEQVDMGSCTVETQGGKLNSSFAVQLDTIKAAFEQYLGHKISILPDEPLILETVNLETTGNDTDANFEYDLDEEFQMSENKEKIKLNPMLDEPSDDELMELEDNFDDIANLDIGDDLDALLGDLLDDDDAPKAKASEDSTIIKKSDDLLDDLNLIDLNDSPELGANDFANGEDWKQETIDEDDLFDDLYEKLPKAEYEDEDGNKFVEFDEFEGDENFGDADDTTDERFPEY